MSQQQQQQQQQMVAVGLGHRRTVTSPTHHQPQQQRQRSPPSPLSLSASAMTMAEWQLTAQKRQKPIDTVVHPAASRAATSHSTATSTPSTSPMRQRQLSVSAETLPSSRAKRAYTVDGGNAMSPPAVGVPSAQRARNTQTSSPSCARRVFHEDEAFFIEDLQPHIEAPMTHMSVLGDRQQQQQTVDGDSMSSSDDDAKPPVSSNASTSTSSIADTALLDSLCQTRIGTPPIGAVTAAASGCTVSSLLLAPTGSSNNTSAMFEGAPAVAASLAEASRSYATLPSALKLRSSHSMHNIPTLLGSSGASIATFTPPPPPIYLSASMDCTTTPAAATMTPTLYGSASAATSSVSLSYDMFAQRSYHPQSSSAAASALLYATGDTPLARADLVGVDNAWKMLDMYIRKPLASPVLVTKRYHVLAVASQPDSGVRNMLRTFCRADDVAASSAELAARVSLNLLTYRFSNYERECNKTAFIDLLDTAVRCAPCVLLVDRMAARAHPRPNYAYGYLQQACAERFGETLTSDASSEANARMPMRSVWVVISDQFMPTMYVTPDWNVLSTAVCATLLEPTPELRREYFQSRVLQELRKRLADSEQCEQCMAYYRPVIDAVLQRDDPTATINHISHNISAAITTTDAASPPLVPSSRLLRHYTATNSTATTTLSSPPLASSQIRATTATSTITQTAFATSASVFAHYRDINAFVEGLFLVPVRRLSTTTLSIAAGTASETATQVLPMAEDFDDEYLRIQNEKCIEEERRAHAMHMHQQAQRNAETRRCEEKRGGNTTITAIYSQQPPSSQQQHYARFGGGKG